MKPPFDCCWTELAAGDVDADEVVRLVRRLPFAELGYAMVDHHRDPPAGPARSGLRAGQDPRPVRRHRRRAAGGWRRGSGRQGPVVLSRATDEQVAAVIAAYPDGAGHRDDGGLAARAPRPERWWWSRPAPPTCRWRGSAGPPCGRSGSGPPWWPTPVWPVSTGCSPTSSCCRPPMPSWWWRAWRARWPAWSAACAPRPSWPCRPAWATGPV